MRQVKMKILWQQQMIFFPLLQLEQQQQNNERGIWDK
jgi:hypothetical protein